MACHSGLKPASRARFVIGGVGIGRKYVCNDGDAQGGRSLETSQRRIDAGPAPANAECCPTRGIPNCRQRTEQVEITFLTITAVRMPVWCLSPALTWARLRTNLTIGYAVTSEELKARPGNAKTSTTVSLRPFGSSIHGVGVSQPQISSQSSNENVFSSAPSPACPWDNNGRPTRLPCHVRFLPVVTLAGPVFFGSRACSSVAGRVLHTKPKIAGQRPCIRHPR